LAYLQAGATQKLLLIQPGCWLTVMVVNIKAAVSLKLMQPLFFAITVYLLIALSLF
jgi:hypothetical protein